MYDGADNGLSIKGFMVSRPCTQAKASGVVKARMLKTELLKWFLANYYKM